MKEQLAVTKKVKDKAEQPAKPATKPRLTAREWAEATALWENGATTLPELAKKYDRHEQSFVQYFRRRGIKKGSKVAALAKKVDQKIEEQHINDAAIIAARIRETKEEHYKMAAGLAKLTWAEVLKAKQDGVPVGTAINNLKALESAMNVLKKAREERYSVLGLDRPDAIDENDVPELVISELTAEQIETLRQRSFRELQEIDAEIEGVDSLSNDDGIVEET